MEILRLIQRRCSQYKDGPVLVTRYPVDFLISYSRLGRKLAWHLHINCLLLINSQFTTLKSRVKLILSPGNKLTRKNSGNALCSKADTSNGKKSWAVNFSPCAAELCRVWLSQPFVSQLPFLSSQSKVHKLKKKGMTVSVCDLLKHHCKSSLSVNFHVFWERKC